MNDFSREAVRKRMREKRQRMTKAQIQNASTQIMHHLMNLPLIKQATHLAAYIANDNEIDPAKFIKAWQDLDSTRRRPGPLPSRRCPRDPENAQKNCYLPVLDPNHTNQLAFVHYQPGDPLKINRYQIPEPEINDHNVYPAKLLDIVLIPLVAFDKHGARLGMGKGYYDRTFAFTKKEAFTYTPFEKRGKDLQRKLGKAGDFISLNLPAAQTTSKDPLFQRGYKPVLIGLAYEFQCADKITTEPWDVPVHLVVTEVGPLEFQTT